MSDGDEARGQLRDLIDERVDAVRRRLADPLLEREAPTVRTFPLLGLLAATGADAVREQLSGWFDGYREGPGYEVRDLDVDADGDLGYCSFLYHVTGVLKDGPEVDMWVRATLVCRRQDGRWRIVHDHESVPFDAATGRALLDLTPGAQEAVRG
jgi:ketosteroid isomerase-like protein